MSRNCKKCIEKRRGFSRLASVVRLPEGLLTLSLRALIHAIDTGHTMTDQSSTLYAKLLGETAPIRWQELQPFFARGALLWVEGNQDLVAVAQAVAENDQARVAQWMNEGLVGRLEDARAADLHTRDPQLWAVVVAPWVLVQERAGDSTLH